MNRYTRVKELFLKRLEAKTGWGRNEVAQLLDEVLLQVADEEIKELQRRLDDDDFEEIN